MLEYAIGVVENAISKVLNFFWNNRLMNMLKEVVIFFVGVPYPEYLYCDEFEMYIKKYKPYKVTYKLDEALDLATLSFIDRLKIIIFINRDMKDNGLTFRVKRIMTLGEGDTKKLL